MITQFKGESRKDAIVNHFSFDIEEEEDFFAFMDKLGYDVNESDDIIETLHDMWRERYEN